MIYWGAEYLATFVETLLCFVFCGAFIDKMAVSNRFTAPSAAAESPPKSKKFHSIGLKSVEHIVKGYKGEFITEVENEMFVAQIMISM